MRLFFDKRGESDDVIFPTVIFVLVNIIFFSFLIAFVYRGASGALAYEQTYAKEIALILDKAKSGSNISIDFSEGYEISKKNNFAQNDFSNLVRIDKDKVYVSLDNGGGYSMPYFSNLETELKFNVQQNKLVLIIK